MNKILSLLLVSAGFVFGSAHAGQILIGGNASAGNGQVTNIANSCTIDFNGGNANNNCGATYTNTVAGNFVTGSAESLYAAPVNDSSTYLSVSPSSGSQSVTITLGAAANYFGFYSGSLDAYNLVQFFLNGNLVDSFTGSDINAVAFPGTTADGDQAQAVYVNYFPLLGNNQTFFDQVVYSSSQNAFETDNHSFAVAEITVPEPGSLALMGLAGAAMLLGMRRKQA